MMHRLLPLCGIGALLASGTAWALSADEILKKVDHANNPYQDRRFTLKMVIREPDGRSSEAEILVGERGFGKQRILFYTAPADLKGMGVLVDSRSRLYTYLPTYHRVRRVAMHARRQTFMGSDFTLDDMSQTKFAPDYEPKVLADEADKPVVVELRPKPGRDLGYTKILIHADRKTWLLDKIEYFDAEGKLAKTETRSKVTVLQGIPMQTNIKMVDARSGHSTEIEITDLAVNVGLRKRAFTPRGLVRGKL